ncbi:MAG: nucleoside-diphosphate kinase [Parachlamydia sp.]|nr:nucleoside-diphosphate kinase [Parachlamydia sp.]
MKTILLCLLLCPFFLGAEQTLTLIKPDAVAAKHIGDILARYEKSGLTIAALKMTWLSKEQAGAFYAVHSDRSFYAELIEFMNSGPIVALVLDGPNAVQKNRELIGDTEPKKSSPGTLRADFGTSKGHNAVHGSDSPEASKTEIAFFFKPEEIVNK